MFYSYKIRLYPTKTQQRKLARAFGCARFVWKQYVTAFNRNEPVKKVSDLRSEFPFLKDVSSCGLGSVRLNFKETMRQYFSKIRKSRIGRPQFKSKGKARDSFSLDNRIKIKGSKISVERIGWVRATVTKPVFGRILGATISKNRAGQYYVSVQVEKLDFQPHAKTGKVVGLDVGLKNFVTLSDGQTVANPRFLVENQDKMARVQRWLSRKKAGSTRFLKLKLRLARLHQQVVDRRTHFLHVLTHQLVRDYDIIGVEDLHIKGMVKNHKLAKHIHDASWAELFRQLEYKCGWYGKTLVQVGRFEPTSKTCSGCGCVKAELSLSERVFTCSGCGLVLDRDLNAAKNIKNLALENYNALRTPRRGDVGPAIEAPGIHQEVRV